MIFIKTKKSLYVHVNMHFINVVYHHGYNKIVPVQCVICVSNQKYLVHVNYLICFKYESQHASSQLYQRNEQYKKKSLRHIYSLNCHTVAYIYSLKYLFDCCYCIYRTVFSVILCILNILFYFMEI
jgi:hypothetical protein